MRPLKLAVFLLALVLVASSMPLSFATPVETTEPAPLLITILVGDEPLPEGTKVMVGEEVMSLGKEGKLDVSELEPGSHVLNVVLGDLHESFTFVITSDEDGKSLEKDYTFVLKLHTFKLKVDSKSSYEDTKVQAFQGETKQELSINEDNEAFFYSTLDDDVTFEAFGLSKVATLEKEAIFSEKFYTLETKVGGQGRNMFAQVNRNILKETATKNNSVSFSTFLEGEAIITVRLSDEMTERIYGEKTHSVTLDLGTKKLDEKLVVNFPLVSIEVKDAIGRVHSRAALTITTPGESPMNIITDQDGKTSFIGHPSKSYTISHAVQNVNRSVSFNAEGKTSILLPVIMQPESMVQRISGSTRYETAYHVVNSMSYDSDTLILATGENYPDALVANALAATLDAPLLLTKTKELSKEVKTYLEEQDIKKVILMGGNQAISEAVSDELKELKLEVNRIKGENRFDTARLVFEQVIKAHPTQKSMLVANGHRFSDALVAGPFSVQEKMPVVLVDYKSVSNTVLDSVLEAKMNTVYALGGSGVLDSKVLEKLEPTTIHRYAGVNRQDTSLKFAAAHFEDATTAIVVRQDDFADSLIAAKLAADLDAPIILMETNAVSKEAESYFKDSDIEKVIVVGGTTAVGDPVLEEINSILVNK